MDMLLGRLAHAELVVNGSWGTDSRDFLLELGNYNLYFSPACGQYDAILSDFIGFEPRQGHVLVLILRYH